MSDYLEFGEKIELSPEVSNQILETVKVLGDAMGSETSGGYSLTIENDTKMWRVIMVCADSFYSESRGYGETFLEAWKAFGDYESEGTDLEEIWRLDKEWDERNK
jgi:hypothetical protein